MSAFKTFQVFGHIVPTKKTQTLKTQRQQVHVTRALFTKKKPVVVEEPVKPKKASLFSFAKPAAKPVIVEEPVKAKKSGLFSFSKPAAKPVVMEEPVKAKKSGPSPSANPLPPRLILPPQRLAAKLISTRRDRELVELLALSTLQKSVPNLTRNYSMMQNMEGEMQERQDDP